MPLPLRSLAQGYGAFKEVEDTFALVSPAGTAPKRTRFGAVPVVHRICVTLRFPSPSSSESWPRFFRVCREEWASVGRFGSIFMGTTRVTALHPKVLKSFRTDVMINPMGGGMACASSSHPLTCYACFLQATKQRSSLQRRKPSGRPSKTDQDKRNKTEEKPQNQSKRGWVQRTGFSQSSFHNFFQMNILELMKNAVHRPCHVKTHVVALCSWNLFKVPVHNQNSAKKDAAVLGDRLPEVTQKPFPGQAASLCSAGIERARKCLQGYHFVRCCHTARSLLSGSSLGVAGESAAVCDPNPPRPSARSRRNISKHSLLT